MINVPALLETLRWVTTNQPEHYQGLYGYTTKKVDGGHIVHPCDTAKCLAGARAELSGYRFVAPWTATPNIGQRFSLEAVAAPSQIDEDGRATGHLQSAAAVAQELMGLDCSQADILFWSQNTILDLWAFSYALLDGDLPVTLDGGGQPLDEDREPITVRRIVKHLEDLAEVENDDQYSVESIDLAEHFVDQVHAGKIIPA